MSRFDELEDAATEASVRVEAARLQYQEADRAVWRCMQALIEAKQAHEKTLVDRRAAKLQRNEADNEFHHIRRLQRALARAQEEKARAVREAELETLKNSNACDARLLDWTKIEILCVERGLAQSDLAKHIGISPGALSNYKTGRRKLTAALNAIEEIANCLGVPVEQIVAMKAEPIQNESA